MIIIVMNYLCQLGTGQQGLGHPQADAGRGGGERDDRQEVPGQVLEWEYSNRYFWGGELIVSVWDPGSYHRRAFTHLHFLQRWPADGKTSNRTVFFFRIQRFSYFSTKLTLLVISTSSFYSATWRRAAPRTNARVWRLLFIEHLRLWRTLLRRFGAMKWQVSDSRTCISHFDKYYVCMQCIFLVNIIGCLTLCSTGG